MSEYPPNNPDGGIWVPPTYDPGQLAVTGADGTYWLLLLAVVLVFLGIWIILHVGKKSDSHHTDL